MTLTKMKACILITTVLLLLMMEYSKGCTTSGGHRMRRKRTANLIAPKVNEELAKFFRECDDLDKAARGILHLPSAVDYVIRDSEWYKNVSSRICAEPRDDIQCWIYAVKYLLDRNSPFFRSTANCMVKWASAVSKKSLLDSELRCPSLHREHIITSDSQEDNELSECIKAQSECYSERYPSLKRFESKSVTTLLKDHYTYCRTFSNVPFNYKQHNLVNLLCQNTECPRTGSKASWRTNITTLYGVATRKDGPIGAAYRKCEDNPCIPNPCKNGGECVVETRQCKCQCQEGFAGRLCEVRAPVRKNLPIPTCSFGDWTQWYDRDDPTGMGDYEDLASIRQRHFGVICKRPSVIDGRLLNGQHWATSGELLTVSATTGLTCVNAHQPDGKSCSDYKVRFCCDPTYSSRPTCYFGTWTQWFNHDDPREEGDYEDLASIRKRYPGMACASPSGVDGRLLNGEHWATSGELLTVSAATGLRCVNAHQPNGESCSDYEVRFCCNSKHECRDGLPTYCANAVKQNPKICDQTFICRKSCSLC